MWFWALLTLCAVFFLTFTFGKHHEFLHEIIRGCCSNYHIVKIKHILNTTRHLQLVRFVLAAFLSIVTIGIIIFGGRILFKSHNICELIFWSFIQIVYLALGLSNCFGKDEGNNKKHIYSSDIDDYDYNHLYASAHNIFFLTILYIIFNLIVFFTMWCINPSAFRSNNVSDVVSILSIVIAFGALAFAGKVSTINSMIIVLSIFLLMQFGFLF